MIKYKKVKKEIEEEIFEYMVCDKCNQKFDDIMDIQEFHHIDFYGGYSSVFGDTAHIKADICQNCLLEMIKDII